MFRKDIPKKDKFAVIYFPQKILVSCPFCECAFLNAAPTDKDYTHFSEHSIILAGAKSFLSLASRRKSDLFLPTCLARTKVHFQFRSLLILVIILFVVAAREFPQKCRSWTIFLEENKKLFQCSFLWLSIGFQPSLTSALKWSKSCYIYPFFHLLDFSQQQIWFLLLES